MFRKHWTQYGMMVYGLSYGNLGLGVGCGELLRICMTSQSAVLLEGEVSEQFNIGRGGTGL